MTRRVLALVAAALLVALALWYGQAPPRSSEMYRKRAEETVQAMRSQAQVATFWLRAASAGRVTREAATVGIEDAEGDAGATSAEFAGWDPPADLVGLRDEVTDAGADLTDALADVRIAAHHGQWGRLSEAAGQLDPLADRLASLGSRIREGGR